MRNINHNKTTQKYKPVINASTLSLDENNWVVGPAEPKIKGAIWGTHHFQGFEQIYLFSH